VVARQLDASIQRERRYILLVLERVVRGAIRASSSGVPDTTARMVVRAGTLALAVGTIHFLINHGDHLADEPVCSHCFVKVALSCVTPFVVSLLSSALGARRSRSDVRDPPDGIREPAR